jgi:hypothetical protein
VGVLYLSPIVYEPVHQTLWRARQAPVAIARVIGQDRNMAIVAKRVIQGCRKVFGNVIVDVSSCIFISMTCK